MTEPSVPVAAATAQSRYSLARSSPPSVRRSTKLLGFSTNLGRSSPWIITRSGTSPPARAAVSAVAVSVEEPTSESLTWASGFLARYSSTESAAPIPVNDQKVNSALGSPEEAELPPLDPHPDSSPRARAPTAAVDDTIMRCFTTVPLLWGRARVRRQRCLGPSSLGAARESEGSVASDPAIVLSQPAANPRSPSRRALWH